VIAPSSAQITSQIQAEIARIHLNQADCTLQITPPLPSDVLPSSALRSILGWHLYEKHPRLFLDLFEPGKTHGHKPPALSFRGPLPAAGQDICRFRISTWDHDAVLLPTLLDILQGLAGVPHPRYAIGHFQLDSLSLAHPDPFPHAPGTGIFTMHGPLVKKEKLTNPDGSKQDHRVDAQCLTLQRIVSFTLFRLFELSHHYGSGTFDWRRYFPEQLAADCLGVDCEFQDIQARGLGPIYSKPMVSGVAGCAKIAHPGADLTTVLAAASLLGIGQNTVEGCGAASWCITP